MNALLVEQMTPLPSPTEPPTLPPLQPGPRFVRSITLAALPTAITCTRLFVASTLQLWRARFLEADAELLAVELVRHSIQACGVTDDHVRLRDLDDLNIIHVRLLGFERTIGIEVWDNVTEPAQPLAQNESGELHGLVSPVPWVERVLDAQRDRYAGPILIEWEDAGGPADRLPSDSSARSTSGLLSRRSMPSLGWVIEGEPAPHGNTWVPRAPHTVLVAGAVHVNLLSSVE